MWGFIRNDMESDFGQNEVDLDVLQGGFNFHNVSDGFDDPALFADNLAHFIFDYGNVYST